MHGVGSTRGVWRLVGPRLGRRRRVLAPDVPGFGDSPPLGPGFDLDIVADALAAGIEERAGRCDLLGHSLGGALAIVLAARHPPLVRRLILAAPAGFVPRGALVSEALGLAALAFLPARRVAGRPLRGLPMARRVLLAGAVADGARLDPGDAAELLEASRHSHRLRPALVAAARADLAPLLARVERPVGVLWGRADRVVPFAVSERVLAAQPEAPVEVILASGHIPQVERPAELVAALERVLERLPAA